MVGQKHWEGGSESSPGVYGELIRRSHLVNNRGPGWDWGLNFALAGGRGSQTYFLV